MRGILFDKDGTLLDFEATWTPVLTRLALEAAGGSHQPPVTSHQRSASAKRPAPSWWTARAREGEVTPGFTKAEILKKAKDDPRAAGGIFERVGGLLSDLLDQG